MWSRSRFDDVATAAIMACCVGLAGCGSAGEGAAQDLPAPEAPQAPETLLAEPAFPADPALTVPGAPPLLFDPATMPAVGPAPPAIPPTATF